MQHLQDISIQYIKGVGPARKKTLGNLGIESVEDMLYFFPRRYEDRTQIAPLSAVKVGEMQTVRGKVWAQGGRRSWYTRKFVHETVIDDGTGRIFGVWFNQPYLERYFRPGTQVILYGKVELYKNRLQMVAPEYEILDEDGGDKDNLNAGRIVPVYPLTKGVSQRYLRKIIRTCLERYVEQVPEILPVGLRNKYRFSNIRRSLQNIHFPESVEMQENAKRRVSFEEFFLFQISVLKRRLSIQSKEGVAHTVSLDLLNRFRQGFPFLFTPAQERAIHEIAGDMQKPAPMLRLLQGDVGSGKTLVALFGCIAACADGKQAAIMAPTEILARQHFQTVQSFLTGGMIANVRAALLVNSLKPKEKEETRQKIRDGDVDLVIGTHALLGNAVDFPKLSFVVIDEQHKFGVRQRALLSSKGTNPDVLVMTATPIPRTLTLTLFGDLDVSVLNELPPGRGQIKTQLYPREQAQEAYQFVRARVQQGEQAYVVYPIIEESEKLDLKAAQAMYKHFTEHEFKDMTVGLVHGRMKREKMDAVMEEFKRGDIKVLVATTVLEVGVDVPNAGVMVIEHAQRFGLAQLHQLRGRVGRGKKDGFCLLIADPVIDDGQARLEAILSSTDGFKIAEQDLAIRGPGHYFGRHQHGLNELRFANPVTQIDLLELARKEAQEVIHADPGLNVPGHLVFKEIIQKRYPHYLSMALSG